jgi:hypothetical protein
MYSRSLGVLLTGCRGVLALLVVVRLCRPSGTVTYKTVAMFGYFLICLE